jgi:ribosome-binding protein aMBF1 (putative translation factor)
MSELTKKPRTKQELATITVEGPVSRRDEAIRLLKELGYELTAVPWREALNVSDDELPGRLLVGARYKESMTQTQLAAATGIPLRHISEMERNKRVITTEVAEKLSKALLVDPRIFLMADGGA